MPTRVSFSPLAKNSIAECSEVSHFFGLGGAPRPRTKEECQNSALACIALSKILWVPLSLYVLYFSVRPRD
jgi:hypothetical protein